MKTGTLGGFFVGERLQSEGLAGLYATERSFVDGAEASRFEIVSTGADSVYASDLEFGCGVGCGILLARPFVLDWFGSLDPFASEFAFNASALDASNGANVALVGVDGAFVHDVVLVVTVTVVQTFSVQHASGGSQVNGLATRQTAVEPELANFDGLSGFQLLSVFHATDSGELEFLVVRRLAFVQDVALGHGFLSVDTFASFRASDTDGFQQRFGWILFAGVDLRSVIPGLSSLVH